MFYMLYLDKYIILDLLKPIVINVYHLKVFRIKNIKQYPKMTLQGFLESHVIVYFSDIIDIQRLCRIKYFHIVSIYASSL